MLTEAEELELLELEEQEYQDKKRRAVVQSPSESAPEIRPKPQTVTQMAVDAAANTSPMHLQKNLGELAIKGQEKVSNKFNQWGDDVTEWLGKHGANPYASAAVGTATALAPDIVSSLPLPGEAAVAKGAVKMRPLAQRAITAALGPEEESIALRLTRPKDVEGAAGRTFADLSEKMAGSAKNLSDQIHKEGNSVMRTLNYSTRGDEGGLDKRLLRSKLDELIRKTELDSGGVVGPANKKARDVLTEMRAQIDAAGPKRTTLRKNEKKVIPSEYLSEADFKGIINAADNNINWEKPELSVLNDLLREFRGSTSSTLKNVNPAYAKNIEPIARKTNALDELTTKFALKQKPGGGFLPTDATASKLSHIKDVKKGESHRILDTVAKETGDDFMDEAALVRAAEQFAPGRNTTNGSRKVQMFSKLGKGAGAATGTTLGWIIGLLNGGTPGGVVGAGGLGTAGMFAGEAAGGALGAYVDRQGGAVAAKLLDYLAKNPNDTPARFLTTQEGRRAMAKIDPVMRLALWEALDSYGGGKPGKGDRK